MNLKEKTKEKQDRDRIYNILYFYMLFKTTYRSFFIFKPLYII